MPLLWKVIRMFAKIFNQIYDSSIVESPETRFTFMDFLVLSDRNGVVDMTHEAIARRTNRPIELIRSTITELEGPDPRSRTADMNGARIYRLDDHRDWGWGIVNYDYFRKLASEDQRRQKTLQRVRKHRVTQCNAVKRSCNDSPSTSLSISSYWEELKRNPLFEGVEIDREHEKAKQWCQRKGRRLTKRFFEKWLEKADRVLFTPAPKKNYMPPAHEPSTEELSNAQRIASEETKKLREQLHR